VAIRDTVFEPNFVYTQVKKQTTIVVECTKLTYQNLKQAKYKMAPSDILNFEKNVNISEASTARCFSASLKSGVAFRLLLIQRWRS